MELTACDPLPTSSLLASSRLDQTEAGPGVISLEFRLIVPLRSFIDFPQVLPGVLEKLATTNRWG